MRCTSNTMLCSILKEFYWLQEFETCAVKLYSGKIKQWLSLLSIDLVKGILLYVSIGFWKHNLLTHMCDWHRFAHWKDHCEKKWRVVETWDIPGIGSHISTRQKPLIMKWLCTKCHSQVQTVQEYIKFKDKKIRKETKKTQNQQSQKNIRKITSPVCHNSAPQKHMGFHYIVIIFCHIIYRIMQYEGVLISP